MKGLRRWGLVAWALLICVSCHQGILLDGSDDKEIAIGLRVVAYNIKHGRGMDGEVDLERTAQVIQALRPDFVTLQEVDLHCARSGGVDEAARLGELCGMTSAFGSFMDYDGGKYGMAVLSRYPIVEVLNHPLPSGPEPRTALGVRARLDDGTEIVVVGIHFYASESERFAQAEALMEALKEEQAPVILAGDFNSTPESSVMKRLEAWKNAEKNGSSLTFPSDTPSTEIDYILMRPPEAFEIESMRVVEEAVASDHRPLLLEVNLLSP